MYKLSFHVRPNGSCPYEEYVKGVFHSGRKADAARIRATLDRLREFGTASLVAMGLAEKMNDVWQLRVGRHRLFYFWQADKGRFVVLNGFLKKTRKTPSPELERAEALRAEILETRRKNESKY